MANNNPTIIVPYRNRTEHLAQFIPAMREYLPEAKIVVVEQVDIKAFNRGKLINAGAIESWDAAYYVVHDVDKIPVQVDYSFPEYPTQLEVNEIQVNNYFGGVTMFNASVFWDIGGFSNHFWGWGGEDNELYNRTMAIVKKIDYRPSVFKSLPHKRSGTFNNAAWLQSQRPRRFDDGLLNCKYKLVSKEEFQHYTLLKVEL